MTEAGLASALPLAVAIPLAGAVSAPIVARIHRRLPLIVSVGALLGSLTVLVLVATKVYVGDGHVVGHYLGGWVPINGRALGIAFAADPFGLAFALASAGLGTLFLVAALSEMEGLGAKENGGFACLFQLLLAALIGSALTADTMNLFVWFEVAAIASYGLTGFFLERPPAVEAAFKIVVLTTAAGFLVFIGVATLYDRHGALNFGQLRQNFGTPGVVDTLALGLLVTGFATKAGLIPFHGWLPDAHTAAPGSVSALFSGLMVDLGLIAIARLSLQIYPEDTRVLGLVVVLGLISAVIGAVLALAQDDLKRLLAWDTVSQLGIIAVGLGSHEESGEAGAIYHLVNHALFKGLLFLAAGSIIHATGKTNLSEMGGMLRTRWITAIAFLVGVLAISGVPPFNGYASLALIHEGIEKQRAVFVLAGIAQVVTVAALGRAFYLAFVRRREEDYEDLKPTRAGTRVAFGTLGAMCVASGVVPQILVHRLGGPAATVLLHPDQYAVAVLSGHGDLPHADLVFEYFKPSHLIETAVTVVLGVLLAWWYVRRPEPRPVTLLRRLHTGSVNDYLGFATLGLIAAAATLMA